MAVTLKSIARQVGVSPMVVSAALHEIAGIRMSEAKRELIRKTAAEMGYRPNLLARTLSGGSSRIIGVVIDSEAPASVSSLLRHIEKEASLRGYRVMVAEEHNSVDMVVAACHTFEQYGVEGVICLAHDYPEQREYFGRALGGHQRMVLLEKAAALDYPYVEVDSTETYREILEFWSKQGRTAGALLMDTPHYLQRNRLRCYRRACAESGSEERLFHPGFADDSGEIIREMKRCLDEFILPRRIDAVLVQNDRYAAALLAVLHERKLRCPEDIAVIGWDDSDYCDMLIPPLASIATDYAAEGEIMVRMLLEIIGGTRPEPIRIKTGMVWRRSAGVEIETVVESSPKSIT